MLNNDTATWLLGDKEIIKTDTNVTRYRQRRQVKKKIVLKNLSEQ